MDHEIMEFDSSRAIKLPLEIVAQIISKLSPTKENRPILNSLSTTNRVLLHATRSVLFRRVKTAKGREYFSFQVRVLTGKKSDLAKHMRHLVLRPSSTLPFAQYKRGTFYSNLPGYEDIINSLPEWRVQYRKCLGELFTKCCGNLEAVSLDCTQEAGGDVDIMMHSIMVDEFKVVWGKFSTPMLRGLEMRVLDYAHLSTLGETLPNDGLLLDEALGWDKELFYSNFSRISSLEIDLMRGTHNDQFWFSCSSTDDTEMQTLRVLDEKLVFPPDHYQVNNWGLPVEDNHGLVPLMPYFRRLASANPTLQLTKLAIHKHRFENIEFPFYVILRECLSLVELDLFEVYLDHSFDSWFLVFRSCSRLPKLKEVEMRRLGYTTLGTCPHKTLKLCCVHDEDRTEMVAFWDEMRRRKSEDGDEEEMEALNINDKKVFCRVHRENKKFVGALRTGGEVD